MTPDGLIATASVRLGAAGIEWPRAEARLLLAHVLGGDRAATLAGQVDTEQQALFEALVARRVAREPMAYITGRREFWSLDFAVGPGVLVPRPDSETLIAEALRLFAERQAPLALADLGTGSGALLIAALHEFSEAQGMGFEASPQAMAYARANLAAHGLAERAELHLANWNTAPESAFDLVLCNPPYIPSADIGALEPEVRDHEPLAALDGGPDGLSAYRELAKLLPRILRPGGHAVLEIGVGQDAAMEPLLPPLEMLRIAPDLAGIPRALVLKKSK
jgi:release factor glutamine methyltransferase